MHKAGFVNIVGNPNVGKSTLMNLLVGEHLSIITHKSQTTRHRIFGIVNGSHNDGIEKFDYQIVYSDTPGVVRPSYKLQSQMLQFSESALVDADILLYVTDTIEKFDKNTDFLQKVKKINSETTNGIPVIVVINKIDLTNQTELEKLVSQWIQIFPKAIVLPMAAKLKFGLEQLQKNIINLLQPCPPFFDKDQMTDRSTKFFVSEIIREKILLYYSKEIPYSVEVEITAFRKKNNITHIAAFIYVERESQKGILIGKNGLAIKKMATKARIDIQNFLNKKVFLELQVKVDPAWRESNQRLQHFGYILK